MGIGSKCVSEDFQELSFSNFQAFLQRGCTSFNPFLSNLDNSPHLTVTTVKPPNKGHFGNNINSSLLSFVERLSSSRRFKMYYNHRQTNYLGPSKASFVERFIILCPYLGGSTIGGLTV